MAAAIAVIAQGAMGSGIARVLTAHGAEVSTLLDGRSPASAARAEAAGMRAASPEQIAEVDLILSIVPPGEALGLVRRLAGPLAAARQKPIVVDCNALDVRTVRDVGQVVTGSGTAFVDGGIIGGPPKEREAGPSLYLSGERASVVAGMLGPLGLKVKVIGGDIGAASALKMAYAAINKGMLAIAVTAILGAERAGAADALIAELRESQPQLAARLPRQLPDMVPKAYRWVAEMREIASFLGDDAAGAAMFEAAAQLYGRIAEAEKTGLTEVAALQTFARKLSPLPSAG